MNGWELRELGMVGLMLVCLPPIQVDFLDELLLFAGLRITDGKICCNLRVGLCNSNPHGRNSIFNSSTENFVHRMPLKTLNLLTRI